MSAQTYTVVQSFSSGPDDDRRHWVIVRGHIGALLCDQPIPEGASVRIENGRAVK